jgi:predicted phage terminase large subunit-like protein
MSAEALQRLGAILRRELSLFLMKVFETLHPGEPPLALAWYVKAICHALTEARAGRKRRLVITVPPRHLKSITATVAFVAWCLGHDPSLRIMVASYSQDLARLHSNLTRKIMEADWYKRDFPGTRIAEGSNRALGFETTAGGARKAVSVHGSVTGFGADIIIVDDCMKADEARSQVVRDETKAWFDGTLLTRINDKAEGIIVSIQQRLHEDDLPAHLLAKGYDHLNLPAIAEKDQRIAIGPASHHERKVGDLLSPERESQAVLDQLRRDLGPMVFSAQYQQAPTTPEGNLLRLEWFGSYDVAPERDRFLKVVQSWDTGMTAAPTSDYSVCTTWGFREYKWYLLDVLRERLDYPDLKRAVIRQHLRWQAEAVIIEDAGSGKSLSQDFRVQGQILPLLWRVDADKETRLIGCLGEIEAGHFLLPAEAPWVEAFRSELRAFPSGRHDDQVDSMTQFIKYQLANWKWVLTSYGPDGRARQLVRLRKRPW